MSNNLNPAVRRGECAVFGLQGKAQRRGMIVPENLIASKLTGPLIRVKPYKIIIAICNCTTTNPPLMRYINMVTKIIILD